MKKANGAKMEINAASRYVKMKIVINVSSIKPTESDNQN